jgi:hypothetical protein
VIYSFLYCGILFISSSATEIQNQLLLTLNNLDSPFFLELNITALTPAWDVNGASVKHASHLVPVESNSGLVRL